MTSLAFSGGQRQRITIVRVLIGDLRILILDEAITLDYESERVVQRNAKAICPLIHNVRIRPFLPRLQDYKNHAQTRTVKLETASRMPVHGVHGALSR